MNYYSQWPFHYTKKLKLLSELSGKTYYYDIENDKFVTGSEKYQSPSYRISDAYNIVGSRGNINLIYKAITQNLAIPKPSDYSDNRLRLDNIILQYSNLQDEDIYTLEPESLSKIEKYQSREFDDYWKSKILTNPEAIEYLFEVNPKEVSTLEHFNKTSGYKFNSFYDVYRYLEQVKMV